jgi:tetratricopeptide (TPR) repeat protein
MNKTSAPENKSETRLLVDAATKRMKALQAQGHYQEALDICLQIARTLPNTATPQVDAAVNCLLLGRWQDAIGYARTALQQDVCHGNDFFGAYAILAHAHGILGQWDETRRYGLQALNIRARQFNSEPVMPLLEPGAMPPPPSAQTRENNVIAFSLFGGDSKYCEPAVLNVQEQPHVYPHWVCRFYVDGSVPESVINRLRTNGAQVVRVEGPAAQWPGPMWRLLALQDPQAHRILFRDADSVIGQREANAINQWLTSGKRFHMMRDSCTHTELLMAGLWGVVGGSLPPLQQLMQRFMNTPLALESKYFADQRFLRQYVWPYARASLMQHDSVFGFMNAVSFPDGERSDNFHIGCLDTTLLYFSAKSNLPEGTKASWVLYRTERLNDGQPREELICCYPGTVKDGTVSAHVPKRYIRWIEQGAARVRLVGNRAT